MKFAILFTPSSVNMSTTPFSKIQQWAQSFQSKWKYNIQYGEVRGDVLRPPHGTNTRCSEIKQKSKRLPLETMKTLQIESLGFIETLNTLINIEMDIFVHHNLYNTVAGIQSKTVSDKQSCYIQTKYIDYKEKRTFMINFLYNLYRLFG